jgi:hypothetical protein
MHARNRTWLLGSDPVERCRQRTLPVEGGDGSTLSLDFTTGVLDPRLTFTRTTNATFINSQGLAEWANSNMFRNTVWTSTSLPTGWLANPSNTGTITYNGDGTISCNASSQTAWIYPNFPYVETASGLSYICSVRVVSISASASVNAILSSGNLTALEYFIDGVSKLASDSVTGPCVVSVRVTASGTQWFPRLGAGVQGVNVSFNLVMSEPHAHPGVAPRAYMANTSTSAANFNTPRFDYDPSTRQPRGLLIEGTSNNLARYSETLETTGSFWGYNAATRTVESSDVNPTGGTGSISFAPTTNGGSRYCGLFLTGQTTTTAYTYSVWLKGKGTNICVISIQNSAGAQNATMTILSQPSGGTASVTSTGGGFSVVSNLSTTGWTRVQVVLAATLGGTGTLNVFMYPKDTSVQTTADSLFAWGAQLETGSGASSYIPTGASQGSRAFDACFTTSISSWFTNGPGTIVAHSDNIRTNTRNLLAQISDGTANNYVQVGLSAVAASGEAIGTLVGGALQGFSQSGSSPSLNTVYKSAYVWDTNYFRVCQNGTLSTADTTGTLATALDRLAIGTDTASSSPTDVYMKYGHIRLLKYWPTRLSDAQLQALTT